VGGALAPKPPPPHTPPPGPPGDSEQQLSSSDRYILSSTWFFINFTSHFASLIIYQLSIFFLNSDISTVKSTRRTGTKHRRWHFDMPHHCRGSRSLPRGMSQPQCLQLHSSTSYLTLHLLPMPFLPGWIRPIHLPCQVPFQMKQLGAHAPSSPLIPRIRTAACTTTFRTIPSKQRTQRRRRRRTRSQALLG
jgi:hypothetical protein